MASNVTETRQMVVVGTFARGVSFHRPALRDAELDKCAIIILRINSGWFNLLRGKLLEGTSVGTGLFAVDLHLVAAEEGGDPVCGTWNEGYSSTDADIGTGMVDRKGPGWDPFRVVSSEVRPLQRIFAIGQPVGEGQVMARADLGVA